MTNDPENFGQGRRFDRQERKRRSKKDRSGFKKSDREKRERVTAQREEERLEGRELIRGRVLSITPTFILVDVAGKSLFCQLRGVLKKERKRATLLVAGDFVGLVPIGENEGVIDLIEKRKNFLSREARIKGQEKLIAANIDQVIIITSADEPPPNLPFIDRALIATMRGKMEPLLVINKMDLLTEKSAQSCAELAHLYQKTGLTVLLVSAKSAQGLDQLKEAMTGKVSLFVGESGVGKSSLINAFRERKQKVQEISQKSKKGVHTTTRAELFELTFGGWCLDTPGIQVFGFVHLTLNDLKNYFSDIEKWAHHCSFLNCSHTHEPNCGVKKAVERGDLSPIRFNSYKTLIKEIS